MPRRRRHYPELRDVPRRWLLVDAADRILPELGGNLAAYATGQLERRGFELHLGTGLRAADANGVELTDGTVVPTATLVWTAGVRPQPARRRLGLPRRRARPHARRRAPARRRPREGAGRSATSPPCPTRPRPGTPTRPPASTPCARPGGWRATSLPSARGRPLRPYRYRMLGQTGDAGPAQGRRRAVRADPAARLRRLVVHPHLPPLPAAAPEPQAARRHRLDGGPVLPPRRGRAGIAGKAGAPGSAAAAALTRRPLDAASTAARMTATPAICQADGDSPRMIAPNMTVATGCSVRVIAVSAAGRRVSDARDQEPAEHLGREGEHHQPSGGPPPGRQVEIAQRGAGDEAHATAHDGGRVAQRRGRPAVAAALAQKQHVAGVGDAGEDAEDDAGHRAARRRPTRRSLPRSARRRPAPPGRRAPCAGWAARPRAPRPPAPP